MPPALVDRTIQITDALFAPFPEATFPKQLNVPQLVELLDSRLATSVPLPPSLYRHTHHLYPDLFTTESSGSAPWLAALMTCAVQDAWPNGDPSELLYVSFWHAVGYGFPELIGQRLGIDIVIRRFACSSFHLLDRENASLQQFSAFQCASWRFGLTMTAWCAGACRMLTSALVTSNVITLFPWTVSC